MMTTVFLLIATVVAVVYMAYALRRTGGVPESLSATYYTLGADGVLFRLAMGLVGAALLPVWITLSEPGWQCLAFLGCGGLLFTAAAPAFRMELEGKVHYTAAVVCCAAAVLWQVLEGLWDVTLLFALTGWMCHLQWKRWCWWLEVAVTLSLLANLWRLA